MVISQTQETPDVCRNEESQPVLYLLNIFQINLYTLVGHNMTKEGQWSQPKLTFVEFHIQLMFPQYLRYHSQMLSMLLSGLRVYEDVIYEYYVKRIKVFMEDPIHKIHKHDWCISETKWNDNKFVMTITGMEGSLRNILLSHSKLVIPWPEIYFRKETWSLELIK